MRRATLIVVGCLLAASSVSAEPVKIWYGTNLNEYRTGSGGEFTAQLNPSWSYDVLSLYAESTKNEVYSNSFQTFCLETEEVLYENGHAYTATLSDKAIGGGVGPAGDPISQATAFLYLKFATGTLAPYNYTPSGGLRSASAGTLQQLIWWLEDSGGAFSNTYRAVLDAEFATTALSEADAKKIWQKDNSGKYAVKAMNMTGSLGSQDQLVLVPVPGAILLGFLGLGYAGMRLRKVA